MKINSLSICGLVTLDLHSLNNEGAEGNYMQTREVQVVDEQGQLQPVNAISGDMYKHIQAEHLFYLAKQQGLPLCQACAKFDANRIVADNEFAASFGPEASNTQILTGAIQTCVMDDLEGILITSTIGGKKRSIARKSTVEFGWIVGKPADTRTESYFHVKFDAKERAKGSTDDTGANVGQNIFHRPASSGRYAVVLNLDLFRVGRNDITMEYVLDDDARLKRCQALISSVLLTFVKPNGAMRNTQNPHIVGFDGVTAFSKTTLPAPTMSALNSKYREEIASISTTLNGLIEDSIETRTFNSLSDFVDIMANYAKEIEF